MWTLALLLATAHACDSENEARVVGWSADGGKALVRLEHADDQGRIHNLSLHLIGASGPIRSWTILTDEDEASQKVRGERWKAAEPEIAAEGVTLTQDGRPFLGCAKECFEVLTKRPVDVPGTELRVSLSAERGPEGSLGPMFYRLALERGEQRVERLLYEGMGHGGEWGTRSMWVDPTGQGLVVISSRDQPAAWSLFVLKDTVRPG